jgi:hypothetical protein
LLCVGTRYSRAMPTGPSIGRSTPAEMSGGGGVLSDVDGAGGGVSEVDGGFGWVGELVGVGEFDGAGELGAAGAWVGRGPEALAAGTCGADAELAAALAGCRAPGTVADDVGPGGEPLGLGWAGSSDPPGGRGRAG